MMNSTSKKPLINYVIGVLVALVIVNVSAWHFDSAVSFHRSLFISGGFLLGMLAMYIAVHLYKWD